MDLVQALTLAEREMEQLEAQRERLDIQIADLGIEIEGLRRAMKRHGLSGDSAAATRDRLRAMPRTEVVEAVLSEASGPLSPNDIMVMLKSMGRDDEYSAVSAALAHLGRTGRAHTVGRGNWLAGPGDQLRNAEPVDAASDTAAAKATEVTVPATRGDDD